MKNLTKFYRSSRVSTRVILLSALTSLVGIFAWQTGQSVLIFTLSTLALGILVETILVHHRLFLASVITLMHLVAMSFFSLTFYETFSQYSDSNTGLVISGLIQVIGILFTIFAITFSVKISSGRVWFNLLISYIIYYASLVLTIVTFPTASPLLGGIIAIIVVFLYSLMRRFLSKKRHTDFDLTKLPDNKKLTSFLNNLESKLPNLTKLENKEVGEKILLFRNKKVVFLLLPIIPENRFQLMDNEVWADKEPVTGSFEYLLNEAKTFSRKYKIRQKRVIPIVVTGTSSLHKGVTPITVRAKNSPDRILGTVLLCKPEKLDGLTKQYNNLGDFNGKELTALIND